MGNFVNLFLVSALAQTSAGFIGQSDLSAAKQARVKNIQFIMGGKNEVITGEVDKDSIRRSFKANVHLQYKCYSKVFGGDSKTMGTSTFKFDLDTSTAIDDPGVGAVAPSNFRIESTGFNDSRFVDCLKKEWGRVKMMAPPPGQVASVVMPIEAKPRTQEGK